MLVRKIARLLCAVGLGTLCVGPFLASCSVPNFSVNDSDGGGAPNNIVPHCQDKQVDNGESDVDCGGTCAPCALTQRCNATTDCSEGMCMSGVCQAATCTDGVQSGTETDVDCGGGGCKPCTVGLACLFATDCDSGVCAAKACAEPSCADRVKNGTESDVDCGGVDCPPCASGRACVIPGDCVSKECTDGKCVLTCGDGTGNCDGDATNGCESNLHTDPANCADCGTACKLPNAVADCSGGVCGIASCVAPFADCNGDPADGCEVNTKTDKLNCGACGTACGSINGTPSCVNSSCEIACNAGYGDCDGKTANGCEKDVSHDVNNCGSCGTVCTPKQGGTAWCKDDQCGETVCPSGKGDCNGNPDDGCEVDLKSDANNCKTCGNLCVAQNGVAACSNTLCVVQSCTTGYADCKNGYSDGCETNTTSDTSNCGKCGTTCTTAGGVPQCSSGACQVKSCNSPAADCNGLPGDGCEVNTSTNQTNCGGCGAAGSNCNSYYPNATSHCSASACTFDGCGTDHANCNTDLTDGCEVNYKTDKNHCGDCGTSCATTHASSTSCNAGTCVPLCTGAFLTCGNPQNGCAIDPTSDDANCGGCNKVCDSSTAAHVTSNHCVSSACNPQCAGLNADCDTSRANGCETPTGTDKLNCGGCNITCATNAHTPSTSCSGGSCNPVCSSGWHACGLPSDGCNVQFGTTSNCTKCGEVCGASAPYCTATGCSDHLDITEVGPGLNAQSGFDGSVTPILTKNHTLTNGSGNYRVVLVGVIAAEPYLSTESVKYNNVGMTRAAQVQSGEGHSYAGVFYMLDAQLPALPGSYPVSVQYYGSALEGAGAFDVVEFKNAQQGAPLATATQQLNNDCAEVGQNERSVNLVFSAAGSFGYSVTAARNGSNASPDAPPGLNATMNLVQATAWPIAGMAGYVGPISSNTTFSWSVANCWNSATVAVALHRLGN